MLPEAAPCVPYAPVDLDGQVGIVVDVSPEVYKLIRLVVHLARCLYAEYGGRFRHPLTYTLIIYWYNIIDLVYSLFSISRQRREEAY